MCWRSYTAQSFRDWTCCLVVCLAGMALCLAGGSPALAQRQAETLSASFRKAAEKILPVVVAVRPVGLIARGTPYGMPGRPLFPGWPNGMPGRPGEVDQLPGGSGVIVDAARGLIVTSEQAISGASRASVIYEDGREIETDRVIRDLRTELVVLAVDPRSVRAKEAEWGDSRALQLGDWVLAIGRTAGHAAAVSAGIVSGRLASAQDDLLRTDAVVGSIGSGGPLIDLDGRIVGINRARLDPRGWPDGFGQAIPADLVRRCVSDLAEFGRVRRGYLGLVVAPPGVRALARSGPQRSGLVITGLSTGSPAAEAGLHLGDVIVALDGQPVSSRDEFSRAVDEAPVGQEFRLTIDRAGKRQDVVVASRQRPEGMLPGGPFGDATPGFPPRGWPNNRSTPRPPQPLPLRPGNPSPLPESLENQPAHTPAADPSPPAQDARSEKDGRDR